MDKKSYIGMALIFAIMMAFYWINKPIEENRRRWEAYYRDSMARIEAQRADSLSRLREMALNTDTLSAMGDTTVNAQKKVKYGELYNSVEGQAEYVVVENSKVKLTFSNKGAKVYSAVIKDYNDQSGENVKLFDGEDNVFGFNFIHNNRTFNTNDLYFEASEVKVQPDSSQLLTFVLNAGSGALTYSYLLHNDSYQVDFDIESKDLANVMSVNVASIDLKWSMDMRAQEKGHKAEGMWSGVYYRYENGDVKDLNATGEDNQRVDMSVDWVAFKDQFFSSIIVANNQFSNVELASKAKAESDSIIKHVDANMSVNFSFERDSHASFSMMFLPNHYYVLDSFEGKNFTELLPLGWGIFGWVNEWIIIPAFKFLEMIFSSYGIIILMLTLLIKLILMPLMYSSYKSQAKMRVLKPQLDAINAKIPDTEPMKRQQAQMDLYKKAGVSPMGGCLPMLVQMPILFAAFRFFPSAIELRGQSFLWADDLATYDSVLDLPFSIPFYGDHVSLFCLLMCIVNVIYSKINMQSQANSSMPGMAFMTYLMPIMMLFFLNDYPAGLCYYYFVSLLITILSTMVIKAFFIDENAILAQIEANKKKPGNKSKWAQRMEALLEEQNKKRR